MARDFPDPSITQDTDGTWYAFGTASGGKNIQAASAPAPDGPWTYIDQDILPGGAGPWTADGTNTWAPDVRVIAPGKYVMYYSGELGNDTALHCIGVATSFTTFEVKGGILGPYTPATEPFACPTEHGGAIDPSGFLDAVTGRRYVVYKVDGNSIGHGGSCNNDVAPYVPTPILLQEVDADDGVTKVGGEPVEILDRTEADGPLVEAPDLMQVVVDGSSTFVLFYSSHCWVSDKYSVNYATSAGNITGPYVRSGKPLVATGDFGTTSPGGATSAVGEGQMVFHANCQQGRCLFVAGLEVDGSVVSVS
ncbi:glycosyl hydrolase [Bombardia bombarda]|uniref:Endo-1,5-alpha-L-arabinanase A n=1 Tax=Bombardia bombarda TaxID=252184 RepID=A0AA40CE66_9PEZI|nr:glycosyl hydrolase [Bombardia bombarda]